MLDHVTIRVGNLSKSKAFYDQVLKPLGMKIVLGSKAEQFYGYGIGEDPIFEIAQSTKSRAAHKAVHVAFKVKITRR